MSEYFEMERLLAAGVDALQRCAVPTARRAVHLLEPLLAKVVQLTQRTGGDLSLFVSSRSPSAATSRGFRPPATTADSERSPLEQYGVRTCLLQCTSLFELCTTLSELLLHNGIQNDPLYAPVQQPWAKGAIPAASGRLTDEQRQVQRLIALRQLGDDDDDESGDRGRSRAEGETGGKKKQHACASWLEAITQSVCCAANTKPPQRSSRDEGMEAGERGDDESVDVLSYLTPLQLVELLEYECGLVRRVLDHCCSSTTSSDSSHKRRLTSSHSQPSSSSAGLQIKGSPELQLLRVVMEQVEPNAQFWLRYFGPSSSNLPPSQPHDGWNGDGSSSTHPSRSPSSTDTERHLSATFSSSTNELRLAVPVSVFCEVLSHETQYLLPDIAMRAEVVSRLVYHVLDGVTPDGLVHVGDVALVARDRSIVELFERLAVGYVEQHHRTNGRRRETQESDDDSCERCAELEAQLTLARHEVSHLQQEVSRLHRLWTTPGSARRASTTPLETLTLPRSRLAPAAAAGSGAHTARDAVILALEEDNRSLREQLAALRIPSAGYSPSLSSRSVVAASATSPLFEVKSASMMGSPSVVNTPTPTATAMHPHAYSAAVLASQQGRALHPSPRPGMFSSPVPFMGGGIQPMSAKRAIRESTRLRERAEAMGLAGNYRSTMSSSSSPAAEGLVIMIEEGMVRGAEVREEELRSRGVSTTASIYEDD